VPDERALAAVLRAHYIAHAARLGERVRAGQRAGHAHALGGRDGRARQFCLVGGQAGWHEGHRGRRRGDGARIPFRSVDLGVDPCAFRPAPTGIGNGRGAAKAAASPNLLLWDLLPWESDCDGSPRRRLTEDLSEELIRPWVRTAVGGAAAALHFTASSPGRARSVPLAGPEPMRRPGRGPPGRRCPSAVPAPPSHGRRVGRDRDVVVT
jgi:hypothetical protein